MTTQASFARGEAEVNRSGEFSARSAILAFACYFAAQALLRTLVSETAELDEGEQVLCAQHWQWGYASDPPLYSWLQILAFQLVGTNIFALALVKNVCLFGTGFFTFCAAKEITRDARPAALAMLSLFLFPQITWESQRDLTHSVLATCLAAATVWMGVRLARAPTTPGYLVFGLCLGLGTLSKYSYGLTALALAIGALTMPAGRRVLLDRRFLLSLLVWAAIAGFHLHWIATSPELAFRRTREVIRSSQGGFLSMRLEGLFSLVRCAFMLGAGAFGCYLYAFWGERQGSLEAPSAAARLWIRRSLWAIAAGCVLVVLGAGIPFKDRWFQPVVPVLAILAATSAAGRLSARSERRLRQVVWTAALAVLVLLPGIPLSASMTNRPTRLNAPFVALGGQLPSFSDGSAVVLAGTRWVGGNMRLLYQQARVIAPESRYVPAPEDQPWLIAWDATKSPPPPRPLAELVKKLRSTDLDSLSNSVAEAPFKYARGRKMQLRWVLLPPSAKRP